MSSVKPNDDLKLSEKPKTAAGLTALVENTVTVFKEEEEDIEINLRRSPENVPVRVNNTSCSSAGSGSGDFHQMVIKKTTQQATWPIQDSDISTSKRKYLIGGTQLNSKKGKKGGKVGGASALSLSIERLLLAFETRNTAKSAADRAFNIEACMEVLNVMPGVPPGGELWCFATRLFMNKNKREMFLVLNDDLRLVWLNNEQLTEGKI
ncbi:DUF1168 domain-containing protein [Cephalotus follicularis]|uniref:DUF1168 domain-containing protein n=1 Tax=Cephalotus follicularis TaxID=3775 RepID=A0A1Q3B3A3_CEPFO|nr:DUF1168 domain-containing protein [Cephalotus follicularis]